MRESDSPRCKPFGRPSSGSSPRTSSAWPQPRLIASRFTPHGVRCGSCCQQTRIALCLVTNAPVCAAPPCSPCSSRSSSPRSRPGDWSTTPTPVWPPWQPYTSARSNATSPTCCRSAQAAVSLLAARPSQSKRTSTTPGFATHSTAANPTAVRRFIVSRSPSIDPFGCEPPCFGMRNKLARL